MPRQPQVWGWWLRSSTQGSGRRPPGQRCCTAALRAVHCLQRQVPLTKVQAEDIYAVSSGSLQAMPTGPLKADLLEQPVLALYPHRLAVSMCPLQLLVLRSKERREWTLLPNSLCVPRGAKAQALTCRSEHVDNGVIAHDQDFVISRRNGHVSSLVGEERHKGVLHGVPLYDAAVICALHVDAACQPRHPSAGSPVVYAVRVQHRRKHTLQQPYRCRPNVQGALSMFGAHPQADATCVCEGPMDTLALRLDRLLPLS